MRQLITKHYLSHPAGISRSLIIFLNFSEKGLLKPKYEFKFTFGEGRFECPFAIAIENTTGRIYIGELERDEILLFSHDGTFLETFPGFKRPVGLAFDSLGNLAVLGDLRIQVHDRSMKMIRSFSLEPFVSKTWGFAIDLQGNFLVSDNGGHQVVTFSPEGKLLRQFGATEHEPEFLYDPHGIAVDPKTGDVIVVDNRRVQIFNPQGIHLRTIGQGANDEDLFFYSPFQVTLDTNRNILVCEQSWGKRYVHVFSIEGEFLKTIGNDCNNNTDPCGVAIDLLGNIYVVDAIHDHRKIYVFG